MPQYLFAYHGGKTPESPEEGEKVMAAWKTWMDGMGDALSVPGAPVGMSKTVSNAGIADEGGSNPVSGYTLVTAPSIEAACDMAKGCPMVIEGSGTVEVAEIHDM